MNTPKLISALVETCKALGAKGIRITLYPESDTAPVHFDVVGVSDLATEQIAKAFGVTLERRADDKYSWLAANEIRGGVYICVNGPMAPVTLPIDEEKVEAAIGAVREAVAS